MKILSSNYIQKTKIYPKSNIMSRSKNYCDNISFGHNYHKGTIKLSDEELLKSITNRLFGDEVKILHNKKDTAELNRFYIEKDYSTLGLGVFHYDDKDELQYITIQKCQSGSMFDYGELSIFDNKGNEIKHLSYPQVKLIRHYRGNMSYNINNVLRYYKEDNPYMRDEIKIIDSMFKDPKIYSTTKESTVVYRGLALKPDKISEIFSAGKIYQDKAFLSTSDRLECAVPNERNVLLKIEVPKGKKYLDMHLLTCTSDFYINEHEMLFDRGSKFLVKNYDPKTNTVTMLFL